VMKLLGPDEEMEEVEPNPDVRTAGGFCYNDRRFEIIDKRILCLELEGDFDAVPRCRFARLLKRDARPLDVSLAEGPQKIGDDNQNENTQTIAQFKPAFKLLPRCAPRFTLRNQEAPLKSGRRQIQPAIGRARPDLFDSVRCQILFELREPEFNR